MKNKHFTMIELLMAIALTVVIGMIVNMAFYHTQVASQRATSTLGFLMKGRAIMDLIARDLSNAYTADKSPTINSPTIPNTSYFSLISILPVQNTQYMDTPPYSAATITSSAQSGYYTTNVVKVGWCFSVVSPNNTATPKVPARTTLYRRISSASEVNGKTGNELSTGALFNASDIQAGDLVVTDEVRAFYIQKVGTGNGYSIRFSMTNAPLNKQTSSGYAIDTTYSPDGVPTYGTNSDSATDILKAKQSAIENGYIWLDFERFVSVMP